MFGGNERGNQQQNHGVGSDDTESRLAVYLTPSLTDPLPDIFLQTSCRSAISISAGAPYRSLRKAPAGMLQARTGLIGLRVRTGGDSNSATQDTRGHTMDQPRQSLPIGALNPRGGLLPVTVTAKQVKQGEPAARDRGQDPRSPSEPRPGTVGRQNVGRARELKNQPIDESSKN